MGGHDLLWGWYFTNRAIIRQTQGRLAEAVEDGRRAIAAKEKALGPNTPDLASSIGNLANHIAIGGDFAGAIDVNQRAVEIFRSSLGSEHPRTALILANHAAFLWRLGRFDQAMELATQAPGGFERETDPMSLFLSHPLRPDRLLVNGL